MGPVNAGAFMEGAAESTVLDAARDGEQGKQQSQMVSIAQGIRNRVDALTSGRLHNRHIDDGDMSISPAAKHTAARGRVVFVGGELSADSGSDEPPPSHYSSDGWDEDSSGLMVGRSKSTSSRGRTGQLLERLNIEQRISLCTELDAWFQLHLKFASQRIENFNSRELARDTVQSDFDVALKDVRDGAGAAEVRSVLKAKQFKDKIQKYQQGLRRRAREAALSEAREKAVETESKAAKAKATEAMEQAGGRRQWLSRVWEAVSWQMKDGMEKGICSEVTVRVVGAMGLREQSAEQSDQLYYTCLVRGKPETRFKVPVGEASSQAEWLEGVDMIVFGPTDRTLEINLHGKDDEILGFAYLGRSQFIDLEDYWAGPLLVCNNFGDPLEGQLQVEVVSRQKQYDVLTAQDLLHILSEQQDEVADLTERQARMNHRCDVALNVLGYVQDKHWNAQNTDSVPRKLNVLDAAGVDFLEEAKKQAILQNLDEHVKTNPQTWYKLMKRIEKEEAAKRIESKGARTNDEDSPAEEHYVLRREIEDLIALQDMASMSARAAAAVDLAIHKGKVTLAEEIPRDPEEEKKKEEEANQERAGELALQSIKALRRLRNRTEQITAESEITQKMSKSKSMPAAPKKPQGKVMRKALSGRAAVSALGGGGGKAAGGGAKAAKRASGARAAGDRDASTSPHPEDRGGSPSAEAAAPVMLNARGEPVVVAPSGGRLRALSLRPPRGSRVAQPSLPSLDAAEQALASLDKENGDLAEEARQLEELIEHTLREQQDDAKQPRQGFRRPSVHKGPKIELLGRSRSPSPGGAGSHEVVRNRSQERQLKPSSTLVVPQQTSGKRLSGTPTSDELLHEAPELQSGEEADAPASPRLATPSASSSASSAALAAPEDSSPAPQAAPDTQRREKAAAKRKAGAAAAKRLRPEGSLPTAGRAAPEAAAAAPRQPGEAPDAPSPAPAGRSSLARAASASPASQETPGGGDGPAVAEDADLAAPAAGGSDAEAASPPVPRVPSAVGADSPASTSEASAEEEEAIPTIQGTKVELVPKEPVTSPKAMLSKFQNAVRMVQQEKAKKRQLTLDVFREIVKERSRQQLMALSCKDLREEAQKMNEYSEELQKSILQMTGKGPPKVRVNAKHEANESLFKEAAALQRDLMELRDNYHKLRKTKRVEDAPQPQVQRAATLAAPAAQRQPRVSAASSVSMDFSGLPQPGAAAPSTAAKTFQSVQRRMSLAMRLNKKVI